MFDMSDARMAVMDGGVLVRIDGPVSVIPIDEERPSAFAPMTEIECEVKHVDRDMLAEVFGPSTRNAPVSLVMERRIRVPRYDTVREYRRHPKGRGRRGKARYVTIRNTYHNVRIEPRTSDGNEMTYELSAEIGGMDLTYVDDIAKWGGII